ncbi:MAG TPA: sulfate adenylyltransferase subunit CysD [Burkholderiaceae bacterium]|jgi:sulfate adenylyltransferase subunit 2|nr:sulfate adenylyltransferase subunit CysD [Burkholderiaceae bacterium]
MTYRDLGLDGTRVWDTESACRQLISRGAADSRRSAEQRLHDLGLLPPELGAGNLLDEHGDAPTPRVLEWDLDRARRKRDLVLFAQLQRLSDGRECLHANDAQGARFWVPLGDAGTTHAVERALRTLRDHLARALAVFVHGRLTALVRGAPVDSDIDIRLLSYPAVLDLAAKSAPAESVDSPRLRRLEAESIHILREAVAEAQNPVMLFSAGKDSSVMLHLARKAFFPAPPPFPLLHVDTRWKFRQMILFRDRVAQRFGLELLVHVNPEAIARDINPFDHGSALHTEITKTEGLKQALEKYRYDVVFGGARRDEEKSRSKERIVSLRSRTHQWDPKNQRPELWNLYNISHREGESLRVFPLSNWTELDVWDYIHQQGIEVVPLYLARKRPVVVRDGTILMIDDARFRLLPDEAIQERSVRFRTLGCYPLSGAIESQAGTIPELIVELANARYSERQGRLIDSDAAASMEKKKQQGYF